MTESGTGGFGMRFFWVSDSENPGKLTVLPISRNQSKLRTSENLSQRYS